MARALTFERDLTMTCEERQTELYTGILDLYLEQVDSHGYLERIVSDYLFTFADEDGKSAEELFAAAYLDNYYFEDDLDPGDVAKYTDADGTFNLYRYGECLLRLSFDLVHDAQNGCYHVLQAY